MQAAANNVRVAAFVLLEQLLSLLIASF